MRMVLDIVIGPTSFQSLRTMQSVIYDIFQGACNVLGLLDDESQWKNTPSAAPMLIFFQSNAL